MVVVIKILWGLVLKGKKNGTKQWMVCTNSGACVVLVSCEIINCSVNFVSEG